MTYHDFRAFLKLLATEGELVEIDAAVAPGVATGLLSLASGAPDRPAVLFRQVAGYEGRLVAGVHTAQRRTALSLGMPRGTPTRALFEEYTRRWDRYPVEPDVVAPSAAPCKQVVRRGAAADLTRLPITQWNEPGGPCMGKGLVVSRDPRTGALYVGLATLRVRGSRELFFRPQLDDGLAAHLAQARQEGVAVDCAVILGNEPTVTLSAVTDLPETWDRYAFAGALKGSPVAITECEGSDLEVPAHSEIVLEGKVAARPLPPEPEPVSKEQPGRHFVVEVRPILAVDTVTHRRDPIVEGFRHVGAIGHEVETLTCIPRSVAVYRELKRRYPQLQAVFTQDYGYVMTAALRQAGGGEARQFIDAFSAVQSGDTRFLFVVDDDIDPFDLGQVLQAVATRFRGEDDLIVARNARGESDVFGFDCTGPKRPEAPRA